MTESILRTGPTVAPKTSAIARGKVTILIPTKNEEDGIGATIDALPLELLDEQRWETEILVVDGHSTDKTREIAAAKGARVVLQRGKGKGWAFRSILPHVHGDYVVMLDADSTYPADAIPQFLEHVSNGTDVVMGSRFKGAIEDGAMTPTNKLGNKALSLFASLLYLKRTTDVCTGMWAFKTRALKTLDLNSDHFELEAELFAQSAKAGLRIDEVPIAYRKRAGKTGLHPLRDGARIAAKLARKRIVP